MGELVALGSPELGDAYLSLPPDGSGPGVVVIHSWWGRTQFFRDLCDRLAADGFVALAPDLYDGLTASTIADAELLADALPRDAAQSKLVAAVDFLVNHVSVTPARVGALGCSLGGFFAIRLSVLKPEVVRSVVTFYGTSDVDPSESRAAFLGHFVEDDEYEPDEFIQSFRRALVAAGRDAEFHTYPGAKHWFFEPMRPEEFDRDSAELAYHRTVEFLNRQLR